MNNKRAKEIFFQNNGQHYHMAHDGFWDEYKKYNINHETEKIWVEELSKLRLKEFKHTSEMIYLIPLVEYFNKYELLDELMSVKIRGTYINNFVIIELLTKLLYKNKNKINDYKDKRSIIVNIVKDFIKGKIPKEYEGYNIEERIEKIKKRLKISE
jgi:hypothetical protein